MVERRVEKGENNKKRGANLALGCREWLKGGTKALIQTERLNSLRR